MRTKEQLLALFENNKGDYFSGEDIAERLSISRTAVWKAVKSLRNDGYNISAISNKGYSLSTETDILSIQGIRKYLKPVCKDIELAVYPTLNSTNTMVREKAASGTPEGYTVIANGQTNGKGRSGRSFYSPSDTGIYMSILLRPHHYFAKEAMKLTTMAAVAVCEAPSDGKNHLAAEFLNRFMTYYSMYPKQGYVDGYRNRSLVIGKEIQVISANSPQKAVALDIDGDCRLIVQYEDGKIESLSSGEISVKLP